MSEQIVKIDTDKFLSADYLNMVSRVIANIIASDDQFNALDLVRLFTEALNQTNVKLKIGNDYLNFYHDSLIKLEYIALPLLEDSEVINLLTNNFIDQFKIEDYKLLDKFNYKLLNIILISDRDNFKKEILRNLLNNQTNIINDGEIKKISDWLKNYVSEVGIEGSDKLIRAQYLMSLKNNKTIKDNEYNNLLVLFKFYDVLSIPIDSPEGFLEEPPVVINGKLYIFRKGVLEPVPNNKAVDEALALLKEGDNTESINKTVNIANKVNAEDDDLFLPAKSPAVETVNEYSLNLSELQQSLKNYPESSLEHKAISQEISRLKKSEFKQSQKADVN